MAFLLLPSLVCLIWSFILLFKQDKTKSQIWLLILMIFATAYFFIDTQYVMFDPTLRDYRLLVKLDNATTFVEAYDLAGGTHPVGFDEPIYRMHAMVCQNAYNSLIIIEMVLMNNHFGMSFRDYINSQRINTAKQLILNNPDEIPEQIAEQSGFVSDSQLIKKFKELEGISPREWQKANESSKSFKFSSL